ncbi:dihydropteroate synthase [Prochlorococcus sp. MIT 1300]|uniref:dihydropteroate synthase n=1 Tax=Prochlorococcus sp. MIT 1300 TaxID=3096218 RepID=UPI002A7645E1|nr:dihydropteroate synthase [Prochlorococcus sp. MIT 1300]
MAIVNITPDSFSDGGQYLQPNKALIHASKCISEGADVLDLGAQSTRPGAEEVGSEEELRRLLPALRTIRHEHKNTLISVDTFLSRVAYAALENGANWINDVSAGKIDPDIFRVVADAGCPYVLMHSRGNSRNMKTLNTYRDVIDDVDRELSERTEEALKAGIKHENIIWDPGIGFAKNTEQNIQILYGLESLCNKGFPLLIGPSRKRFIAEILGNEDLDSRDLGTEIVVCRCTQAKVSMVRVHNVGRTAKTLTIANKLW